MFPISTDVYIFFKIGFCIHAQMLFLHIYVIKLISLYLDLGTYKYFFLL